MNATFSCMLRSANVRYTCAKPSLNGIATWSANTSGAAPVPPSPPSMVMKSGARPLCSICCTSSRQKLISPTALLIPTGSPVASAIFSMKSSIELTSRNAVCASGEMQSLPIGTSLIFAISGVIFAEGSTPPSPGFAPCESFSSIARTGADATFSRKRCMSKRPLSSRQPKYPGPDLPDQVAALAMVV
jgi:hypothetical protein